MSKVIAYLTADRHTDESLSDGISEECGFVDMSYSQRVLFPSRNDVKPFFEGDDTFPNFYEEISGIFSGLFGSYESNGDGSYYQIDWEIDNQSGDYFSYAVHFERENANGKREDVDVEEEYKVSI